MTDRFDAIVIGGGHNGLICAAYLARAGVDTLLVEARAILADASPEPRLDSEVLLAFVLVAVLAVGFLGCTPKEKPDDPPTKGGSVEIRVPVTEKKPTPPEPKKPEPAKPAPAPAKTEVTTRADVFDPKTLDVEPLLGGAGIAVLGGRIPERALLSLLAEITLALVLFSAASTLRAVRLGGCSKSSSWIMCWNRSRSSARSHAHPLRSARIAPSDRWRW